MQDGVSFTRLDRDRQDRFQSLRRELGVSGLGINLIVFQPGQVGRIHRHAHQEEVYLVLDGELSLYVEGDEHRVAKDGVARVGPEVRRQLVNRRPEPLVLLALGGTGEHAGRDGEAFASWEATEGAPPQEIPLPADVPVEAA
jgi:mannose-6-phosphate isomerase-like protein (cupin superfamily)